MAFAETQKLTVALDLGGNFAARIASAKAALAGLEGSVGRTGQSFAKFGGNVGTKFGTIARSLQSLDRATGRTQRSLSKFGGNIERGIVLGTTAAAAGFVAVAKAAGDFEAQMNTIATIVDRRDIPQIGEQLRKTARDTGISLDDLSSAYYDLASAGVKGQLATDALNDAVKLGIGGLATTAETVDLLTTAINAYQLDSKGAAKATDQFAQAVADGKVKASEIANTFADVASIAKTFKIGIDQIAASYAYLTAQGVPAGEVTTEMQRAIISLVKPTKDLETAQKKLGVSFTKEIATKGLVGALQELRTYSDKTGVPLIALLGRIEAVKYTLQTTDENFAPFNAELKKMGNVSGEAAAQMAERQQGLNYQLNVLKTNVHDAAISIGSALLPKLTPLIAKISDFLKSDAGQSKIKGFATNLADGFGKLADAVQKVDWQPFIDGLKLSGQIAQTVIGAFRSLPAGLQELVVAGFALNKVTGGLGSSIVKDLGGAVIGQLAKQRGSSPADPLWVAQVGGVPGTGVPGASGGLGTLGKVALGVTVLGISYEAGTVIGKAFADWLPPELKGPGGLGKSDSQLAHERADAANPQIDFSALANANAREDRGLLSGAVTSFAGKIKDDLGAVKDQLRGYAAEFKDAAQRLAHPKSNTELASAAKAITKLISTGRGGAEQTAHVLASLEKQLAHTHDPKLQAALRADIAKVQGLLPGRQFAAKELANAQKILSSHESENKKIVGLQEIERALKDRGLPHAAAVIAAKIAAAQRATTVAQHSTTQAIKDKDLSVSVTVPVSISVRDQFAAQRSFVLAGNLRGK